MASLAGCALVGQFDHDWFRRGAPAFCSPAIRCHGRQHGCQIVLGANVGERELWPDLADASAIGPGCAMRRQGTERHGFCRGRDDACAAV